MSRLFNNVKYSDITIRLGETEVDLHREISSRYFRDTAWQGANAHSYWRIFNYLYQEDYSEDAAIALEGFGKLSNLQQFAYR